MHVPILAPLHPQGWIFVAIFLAISFGVGFLGPIPLSLGLVLTGWCAYFFRDPARVTPTRAGLIVSPADGFVQAIVKANPPAELGLSGNNWTRISVFLSVFDVHINRIPLNGKIIKSVYHAGKFFNASLDKASEHNERQAIALITDQGQEIAFVQIAGLIARRILCHIETGQQVRVGERYGMIRFGSRTDLYLPEGVASLVIEGQRVIGGETIMADLHSTEEERLGDVR